MGLCCGKEELKQQPLPEPEPEPEPMVIEEPETEARPQTPSEDIFLASDCAFIEVENVDDEIEITSAEDHYPPPFPHGPSLRNVVPVRRFFEADLGQNDSDEASLSETDDSIDTNVVIAKKRNIFESIDQHARKAKDIHMQSFQMLFDYLSKGIATHNDRELMTVRAILSWMASQDVVRTHYGDPGQDTPVGLLQMLREKRTSYATVFTLLCRKAYIKCVRIRGISKYRSYEPGELDSKHMSHVWTAVYVHKAWHFIDPFYACRGIAWTIFNGWIKLDKVDSKKIRASVLASHNIDVSMFCDYFFFIKPEQFIVSYFPDDKDWQLLPELSSAKSVRKFMLMPFFLPPYFDLGLSLLGHEQSCILNSTDGLREIGFRADSVDHKKINLQYELHVKDVKYSNRLLNSQENLSRLVFFSRVGRGFMFEIRIPCEGIYKFIIFGGPYETAPLRCCEFRINCPKALKDCHLLPIEVGKYGWGPGPRSEKAGLLLPSKAGGKIVLKKDLGTPHNFTPRHPDTKEAQDTIRGEFTFKLDPDSSGSMDYSAELSSGFEGGIELDNLQDHVHFAKTETEFKVQVDLPPKGEYALTIKAAKKKKKLKPVCHYLLTTVAARRDTVPQKFARETLLEVMKTEDHVSLDAAIQKCLKEKIDEQGGDLVSARERLPYLIHKNALKECIHRRHLGVIRKTLKNVDKYRHKITLKRQVALVKRLEKELEQLEGFTRDIPDLKDAASELLHSQHPPDEVRNTVMALFMLCREPEYVFEDWRYAQTLMRTTGDKGSSIFDRMMEVPERSINKEERQEILDVLEKYTETQVRKASQAAATFYIWTKGVLSVYSQGSLVNTDQWVD